MSAGLAAWILAAVIVALDNFPNSGTVADGSLVLTAVGLLGVGGGLLALLNSIRMGITLRRHAWVAWSVRYREIRHWAGRLLNTPNGTPTLFVGDDGEPLTVMAFK